MHWRCDGWRNVETHRGMWRSLVAHLLWEQGVAGSNPVIPTSSAYCEAIALAVARSSSLSTSTHDSAGDVHTDALRPLSMAI